MKRQRRIRFITKALLGAMIAVSALPIGLSAFLYPNTSPAPETANATVTEQKPVAYYDSNYFTTVEAAVNSANAAGSKTVYVIPGTNPTITTSFTINSGITLNLPYSGTTVYTDPTAASTTFVDQDNATYMKSKVTVASGVTITNNGTINIGGTIACGGGGAKFAGHTAGDYAQLTMANSSKINCENGSRINVYGYITESSPHSGDYAENTNTNTWPQIVVKSGSILNAPFVLHDFRGGSITSALYSDRSSKHVIFFNEYEVQNIKPLIQIQYGGQMTVNTWLYASSSAYSSKDIKMIGNSSSHLFQMSSGASMTFKYNYGNNNASNYANRYKNYMDLRLSGNFTMNALTLSVAGTSLDTSSYRFALSYLFHIRILSGTTSISNMAKMMAGAKLLVSSGATLTLGDMVVYTDYVDPSSDGHTAYPSAAAAASFVNSGTVTATKLAGRINTSAAGATLTASTTTITSYEHLNHSGSSLFTSATYTTLEESLQLRLLKNGSIANDYTNVGGGTYHSYQDAASAYGWFTGSGKISYNANGSSDTFSDKNITIGSSGYTVTSADLTPTPTRAHYSFTGWYMEDTCVTPAEGQVLYSSVTLYAGWMATNYSIVYHFDSNADGTPITGTATNNPANPTSYNIESSLPLYPASYDDFIFDGWYLDSGYNTKVSTITGSLLTGMSAPYTLNLYGRWYAAGTETYTITYSNSNTDEGCTCIPSEDILSVNISKLAVPDLSGKNSDLTYDKYFDGWYLDSTYQTKYTSPSQITGSTTLYACWRQKNQVTLQMAGNDLLALVRFLPKDATFTIPNVSSYGVEVPEGYEIEWAIAGGDLNGETHHTGDSICLSHSWGQTIVVSGSIVAKTWTCTIKVGTNETGTYSIKRGSSTIVSSTTISAGGTATPTVKTGDVITFTVSANSNYTAGSITQSNLNKSGNNYTVTGAGAPSITVAKATSSGGGCVTPDTLVTMADGSKKQIQYVTQGEMIQVWNHETGQVDVAPVTFNEKEEAQYFPITTLSFSDGTSTRYSSEHGYFDVTRREYVYFNDDNYDEFVGDEFLKVDSVTNAQSVVRLLSAVQKIEYTEIYSLPSYYHLNFFADEFLSMPGGIKGLFNIFELDETFKYDEAKKAADIEQYGLFTREELAALGVDDETYDAYPAAYLKVSIGKGIMTEEDLMYLIERYGKYTQ